MTKEVLKHQLARFELTAPNAHRLHDDFRSAISDCDLRGAEKLRGRLRTFAGVPGVYFWILRAWETSYKLYVGQTTSLSYRLSNYTSPFQPNATNDFKLRISYDFFIEAIPGASFDLYFCAVDVAGMNKADARSELRRRETETITHFDPVLLNQRGTVPADAKEALEKAYVAFYRANLASVLSARYDA